MFNVIISGQENAWETDGLMRMDITRFKEYSGGPEADSINIKDAASRRKLDKSPALLLYENGMSGENAEVIRYGFLEKISVNSEYILFGFREEGRISRGDFNEFTVRLGIDRYELNRTHWAIKEGGIPSGLKGKIVNSYDVVFSFAGEDREYVEKVAKYLRSKRVKVFYDKFEEAQLWGRDLAEHFAAVYGQNGRYCVIFISANYVKKMWTKHERRTALERALKSNSEYILPARFDDTDVEGIRSTVGFIRVSDLKPAKFGKLILDKLGHSLE